MGPPRYCRLFLLSFLLPFILSLFPLPLSFFLLFLLFSPRAFARTYDVKRQFHAGSRLPPPPLRGCGVLKQHAFPGKLRAISTARLCRRRLYTCGLSTSSSSTALNGSLIFRRVSHLDAFSAYLFRAWLPSGAAGTTTGTPEARPSRSSRTRDSPRQTSCAHNR